MLAMKKLFFLIPVLLLSSCNLGEPQIEVEVISDTVEVVGVIPTEAKNLIREVLEPMGRVMEMPEVWAAPEGISQEVYNGLLYHYFGQAEQACLNSWSVDIDFIEEEIIHEKESKYYIIPLVFRGEAHDKLFITLQKKEERWDIIEIKFVFRGSQSNAREPAGGQGTQYRESSLLRIIKPKTNEEIGAKLRRYQNQKSKYGEYCADLRLRGLIK